MFTTQAGRDLTPEQAACYLTAGLLLQELKRREPALKCPPALIADEVAMRTAAEELRRELLLRSGEPGNEAEPGEEEECPDCGGWYWFACHDGSMACRKCGHVGRQNTTKEG